MRVVSPTRSSHHEETLIARIWGDDEPTRKVGSTPARPRPRRLLAPAMDPRPDDFPAWDEIDDYEAHLAKQDGELDLTLDRVLVLVPA